MREVHQKNPTLRDAVPLVDGAAAVGLGGYQCESTSISWADWRGRNESARRGRT
jgi:hypothetical protein